MNNKYLTKQYAVWRSQNWDHLNYLIFVLPHDLLWHVKIKKICFYWTQQMLVAMCIMTRALRKEKNIKVQFLEKISLRYKSLINSNHLDYSTSTINIKPWTPYKIRCSKSSNKTTYIRLLCKLNTKITNIFLKIDFCAFTIPIAIFQLLFLSLPILTSVKELKKLGVSIFDLLGYKW